MLEFDSEKRVDFSKLLLLFTNEFTKSETII